MLVAAVLADKQRLGKAVVCMAAVAEVRALQ
jgi:hypothetical protein